MSGERMEIEMSTEQDSGWAHSYFTRGHVDWGAFYDEVAHEYDPDPLPPFGYVRHTYWRCVPRGDGGWSEYVECGPGRGAFAVTVLDAVDYRRDMQLPSIIASNERSVHDDEYRRRNLERLRTRWAEAQARMAITREVQEPA